MAVAAGAVAARAEVTKAAAMKAEIAEIAGTGRKAGARAVAARVAVAWAAAARAAATLAGQWEGLWEAPGAVGYTEGAKAGPKAAATAHMDGALAELTGLPLALPVGGSAGATAAALRVALAPLVRASREVVPRAVPREIQRKGLREAPQTEGHTEGARAGSKAAAKMAAATAELTGLPLTLPVGGSAGATAVAGRASLAPLERGLKAVVAMVQERSEAAARAGVAWAEQRVGLRGAPQAGGYTKGARAGPKAAATVHMDGALARGVPLALSVESSDGATTAEARAALVPLERAVAAREARAGVAAWGVRSSAARLPAACSAPSRRCVAPPLRFGRRRKSCVPR